MSDTDWMARFRLEFVHEMAESRPQTEAEWGRHIPSRHRDVIPWPGTEKLLELRQGYQHAHDERRERGERCGRCEDHAE